MLKILLNRVRLMFLSLLFVCLMAATAHAQGVGEESIQHQIATWLLTTVGTILSVILVPLAMKALSYFHIQTSAVVNDEIQEITKDALAYAQSWVQGQIDKKLTPTTGDIQSATMAFIVQQITSRGLPQQAAIFLENLVKAELAKWVGTTEPAKQMKAAFIHA